MAVTRPIEVVIDERRSLTLPSMVLEALHVAPGDALEARLVKGELRLRPKRSAAAKALQELQDIVASSGVPEDEFQAELTRARAAIVRERHGSETA